MFRGLLVSLILLTLPMLGSAAIPESGFQLAASDELVLSGPIALRLEYSETSALISTSGDWSTRRQGKVLFVDAQTPTEITLAVPSLARVELNQGQLMVKVQGNERLYLPVVSAPEIRLQLLGQSRFDSEQIATDHLFVAMTEQGKASLAHVKAELLELDMSGHGDMNVAGEAKRQQVELRDYSHYDAHDLQSDEATVALADYAAGLIRGKTKPMIDPAPFTSLSVT